MKWKWAIGNDHLRPLDAKNESRLVPKKKNLEPDLSMTDFGMKILNFKIYTKFYLYTLHYGTVETDSDPFVLELLPIHR